MDLLLQFLGWVLKKNYFLFEGKFYEQSQGTSMGSNVAPAYANLFMAHFEDTFVYNNLEFWPYTLMWLRYIDDLFFIWQGSESTLLMFAEYLNSRIPTIKFTLEYDKKQIHFLDVTVGLTEGKLTTDIYRKPTDRVTYLDPNSFHPPSTIRGLPYSQLLRVKRIVSEEANFDERSEEMLAHFSSRGYETDLLEDTKEKVKAIPRSTLLSKKTCKKSERLPFVTTYSRQSGFVKGVINRHWHLLQMDRKLEPWVAEPPMMAYKRASNLKDQLVHALSEPQRKQDLMGQYQLKIIPLYMDVNFCKI
ncbi:uncharacterized protein LOC121400038 [Xenopus laevis]|uniref:Uncharacterized protein LOC121400038 n=1 Tax=Xenopus laevis TaxID=8355 RepID=A0A8J1M9L0_XENLA|nr:uncharacterized protein LOC121400038 [Xenopus laevis]